MELGSCLITTLFDGEPSIGLYNIKYGTKLESSVKISYETEFPNCFKSSKRVYQEYNKHGTNNGRIASLKFGVPAKSKLQKGKPYS